MSACRLFPPEYDTSCHCGEHGGTAWLYGPNPTRCDRASETVNAPADDEVRRVEFTPAPDDESDW